MIGVTGATGFIGHTLIDELSRRGSRVKILLRNNSSNRHFENVSLANIDGTSDYSHFLKGVDTLIHCAARAHVMKDKSSDPLEDYREVNTKGTLNLARQAVDFGVKRFIFISSIKVNGESTKLGKPYTSNDAANPNDYYGQSKAEAEEQLLILAQETGLEVVIIRPTLVYGSGVKANFASLMNLVAKGLPLPFGAINCNKRSLVSVDNLVDLIITCINHSKAVNQVFLVSDDDDVSTAEMIRYMGVALGKPARLIPVPVWCFSVVGKLLGKENVVSRLTGTLQVDISNTKKRLDWTPPYRLNSCFKQTADAFLKRNRF
jgi:UDP-glucose 4-epimerase